MPSTSDLVHLSRLEVQLSRSEQVVTQTDYEVGSGRSSVRLPTVARRIWQTDKTLGQGGFGTVYLQKCVQCTLNQTQGQLRAVKEVRKISRANYSRELEALALFSQPRYRMCFVEFLGWYESERSIFVTMEYLPHGDLEKYVADPLPEDQARDIISQVIEGLVMMHERGFAHRDLKPANILVSSPGPHWWVKLADFGVSKRTESGVTDLRTRVYTPAFAAPEVLQQQYLGGDSDDDEPAYTDAVDVWAIGMVAFLILVGHPLFDDRRIRRSVMNKGELPDAPLTARQVSDDARSFLHALLKSTPQDRPSAAQCRQHEWLRDATAGTSRDSADLDTEALDELLSRAQNIGLDENTCVPARWTTVASSPNPEPDPVAWEAETTAGAGLRGDTYEPSHSLPRQTHQRPSLGAEAGMDELHASKAFPRFSGETAEYDARCVAPHPDGRIVALTASSGGIYKLDLKRSWMNSVVRWTGVVVEMAYSPDGEWLAIRTEDGSISLVDDVGLPDIAGHRHLKFRCPPISSKCTPPGSIAFSNDSKLMAVASCQGVQIFDIEVFKALTKRAREEHSPRLGYSNVDVSCVKFANGGRVLILIMSQQIKIWDLLTLGLMAADSKGDFSSLSVSKDGRFFASVKTTGVVVLCDVKSRRSMERICLPVVITAVAFSMGGTKLALGRANGTIVLWSLRERKEIYALEPHGSGPITYIHFMPRGKRLLSVSTNGKVNVHSLRSL